MSTPVQISPLELRRGVAVGTRGIELGLDQIHGVVLADVIDHDPRSQIWVPPGQAHARIWAKGDELEIWRACQGSPGVVGLVLTVEIHRPTWWTRTRAWWRWNLWRLGRALGGPG